MKGNKIAKKLGESIADSYRRWEHIYRFGAGDPTWEDGCNLNLVRNHIIYDRMKCEEELRPEEFPQEYFLPIPPEVDAKYMALEDEIRESAKKSLDVYIESDDYKYLLTVAERLDGKQKNEICIMNVLGYVSGLRQSIEKDDLVAMRRHRNADTYLDSFESCRRKAEAMIGVKKVLPQGQLSLFDLFDV